MPFSWIWVYICIMDHVSQSNKEAMNQWLIINQSINQSTRGLSRIDQLYLQHRAFHWAHDCTERPLIGFQLTTHFKNRLRFHLQQTEWERPAGSVHWKWAWRGDGEDTVTQSKNDTVLENPVDATLAWLVLFFFKRIRAKVPPKKHLLEVDLAALCAQSTLQQSVFTFYSQASYAPSVLQDPWLHFLRMRSMKASTDW